MNIPHLKKSLFRNRKEAFVGSIIIMLAVTFLNVVPELGQSLSSQADDVLVNAQAPSTPPNTRYILVDKDGNATLMISICAIHPAGDPYPSPANFCSLSDAIYAANNDTGTDTITIVFSNTLTTINLTSDEVFPITRPNGPLVIDGCQSTDCSTKEIIRGYFDSSNPSDNSEWAFKIDTSQKVTIQNIAFTHFLDKEAFPIRSGEDSGPWFTGEVTVQDNYFGSVDGQTLNSDHASVNGVFLKLDPSAIVTPKIVIRNNVLYNIQANGVIITAQKPSSTESCTNDETFVSSANAQISNNKIGIKKNNTGGEGSYTSGDEWGDASKEGLAAIFVCGIHAEIDNNIIGNSRLNPSATGVVTIFLAKTNANVHHNQIGALSTGSGSNTNIYGQGIVAFLNYSTPDFINGNQIHDNFIGNIKRGDCNTNSYSSDVGQGACSGTAINITASTHNIVYGNQVGNELNENDGYGIAIDGFVAGSGSLLPSTLASSFNKIFKNTISYNKADGISVRAAQKLSLVGAFADFTCSDSSSGSTFPPQNCFNTFSQNQIFRNGRYSDNPVAGFGPPIFPGGGIGIDLKSGSGTTLDIDYPEQKEGATASTNGTSNDSDITFNDATPGFGCGSLPSPCNDLDKGGNDLLNYPFIHPTLGTPTPNSTRTEIHGNLNTSKDGRYWVEVFRVRCDAETDNGNVTETNALTGQCDTDHDHTGIEGIANGQGFEFLCGSYVTKSSSNTGEWDCKPADFGNTFNGGLITSTATEVRDVGVPLNFGKNIVPAVSLKYTCELAGIVFGTNVSGLGQPCNGKAGTSDYTNLLGLEANIVQALGNSSEFSQDVFIATPDLSITKKVRGCTGTTKESCTINTFGSETTTANSTTVEYRLDAFNNGNSALAISVNDTQPTGITFNQVQCEYFIVDSVSDTRPTSGAQPCLFSAMNLSIPGGSGTIAIPDKKHLVVYLLATVNGSGTISNIGTVTESSLCPTGSATPATNCSSEARVIVQAAPGDVSLSKTVTPSTITSGSIPQDVTYTVTLTKEAGTVISNDTWSDTFPTTPVAMTYKDCTVTVTPASASAGINCPTFPAPATPGNLHAGNLVKEITQIIYTYKGTIPANAVTSGTGTTVTNTTEFIGFNGAINVNKQASASLNILPPGSTGTGSVTLKHVFDNADTGATVATVTSSTAVIDKDYFIVVTFANLPTSGISNFKLSNNFAVTTANLNTPMTYSDCQINYFGATPSGAPVTCTIPAIGGSTEFYPTGITIPQGLTKIIVKYKGHIAASSVAAGNTAYIINRSQVDAPGIADVVRALATASADATLNINGPGAPTGTGNITINKSADNNVTTNDRSEERIYTPDETVNYTVTILNNGTGIANGATLKDSVSRNFTNLTADSLPTGSAGGFSENNLTVSSLNIPTGSAGVTLKYRGTLKGNSQFSLSEFDLDSSADPLDDEDFYAPTDADIEENIDITNNNHKDENDALDAPDNKYVSLGNGGDIVIDLGKKVIVDGSGDDFGILEIDHDIDDKDQTTEAYTVLVSQDGDNFEKVTSSSTDSDQFDLGRAHMSWAQFIKIEDDSIETKASAPGADIDAVCLFNIGVQLPNTAEVQFGDQRLTDNELVTVDVTDVFDDQLDDSDCVEPEAPAPVIVFPPGPPETVVVPPPERLPVTGPLFALGTVWLLAGLIAKKRKW